MKHTFRLAIWMGGGTEALMMADTFTGWPKNHSYVHSVTLFVRDLKHACLYQTTNQTKISSFRVGYYLSRHAVHFILVNLLMLGGLHFWQVHCQFRCIGPHCVILWSEVPCWVQTLYGLCSGSALCQNTFQVMLGINGFNDMYVNMNYSIVHCIFILVSKLQ